MKRFSNVGFSLVELLIVLAISGVIMGAVFQVFNSSRRSFIVQDDVAEMQQNVRVAKMFLERDVRMAGSGVMNMSSPQAGVVFPLIFENNITDGTALLGTDRITVVYKRFDGVGCGTAPSGVNLCSDLPELTLSGTMDSASTTANLNEDLTGTAWLQNCYCNGTTYTSVSNNIPYVLTSPDMTTSALLIATDIVGGSPSTLHNDVNAIPQESNDNFYMLIGEADNTTLVNNKTIDSFSSGSTINFYNPYYATFYIANNDSGSPCLYRLTSSNIPDLIAEHVEDLQASFVLDDGSTINAPTSGAGANELSDTQKDQIRLVKISVLARTAHEQRDFTDNRPAIEDHAAGGNDGYRRRLLTFTVKVRNFGL